MPADFLNQLGKDYVRKLSRWIMLHLIAGFTVYLHVTTTRPLTDLMKRTLPPLYHKYPCQNHTRQRPWPSQRHSSQEKHVLSQSHLLNFSVRRKCDKDAETKFEEIRISELSAAGTEVT